MARVSCETGPSFAAAERAAGWIRDFYPDISVTLEPGAAQLSSNRYDAAHLRLTWQSSLANEVLLCRGAAARAGFIEALVR